MDRHIVSFPDQPERGTYLMQSEEDAQEFAAHALQEHGLLAEVELAFCCDACDSWFPESETHVTDEGDMICAECAQRKETPTQGGE